MTYAYPKEQWQVVATMSAQQLAGVDLSTVVRFRDPRFTHADVVITGHLAEVAHDASSTAVLIYTTDAGDKAEYVLEHGARIERMGEF